MSKKYIIGIDEVGRGPIAGPLVVCACALLEGIELLSLYPKGLLRDSKKLSAKQRSHILSQIGDKIKSQEIIFGIAEITAEEIDRNGLAVSIKTALSTALLEVHREGVSESSYIYLDGSLKVDDRFPQETVIKGDEKILEISLASIYAKEYRDTLMKSLAEEYPGYGFQSHVGYGTKAHYMAIEKHGITKYHRKSFLKKVIAKTV